MSAATNVPAPGSPLDWLRHAASDLHLAKLGLADRDVLRNQVAFHAQQAAEKSLKAVLADRKIHFPKTHDLEALIEIIQLAGIAWPLATQHIEALSPFAVETRYPGGLAQISDPEAEEAIESAERVLTWARTLITGAPSV